MDAPVIVIGAGPAGLSAAHELTRLNTGCLVLEKEDKVGGISRTEDYKGYRFDMGGHRFFTKVKEVDRLWREVLGADFLRRPRLSRIYYRRRFFSYPLKPLNALFGLGVWQAALVILSYIKWQLFPYKREDSFEQWVTNRFGQRLFEIFFKAYTQKVWGIPCSELRAEWAAQRIKDLSLKTAVVGMFFRPKQQVKTLIETFDYPRLGPGMLWSAVKEAVERRGGGVRLNSKVVEILWSGNRITSVVVEANGCREMVHGSAFFSSMPVTEFVKRLNPSPPFEVLDAASRLRHRDFLTVCLLVDAPNLFTDNWIYVHDPAVKVGRIQNFKNWSADLVADGGKTSLGLEYFCAEGDELWNMADADLVELGKRELESMGLAKSGDVVDGCVFRVPKAYPVYDSDYSENLATIREFTDRLENFQTIGRNGLHRYDNQDHAMFTGMLAARNLAMGESSDLWSVNTDGEYQEEIRLLRSAAGQAFQKLDRVAFGLAVGTAFGLLLFLATLVLVLKGGEVVGPNLRLLGQYFPGYAVTPWGSVLGLIYGFLCGFASGWGIALLRNTSLFLTMAFLRRGAELQALRRVLDYI